MTDPWILSEDSFDPQKAHHKETIFTAGNGYLCTRGAFEEGYPGDRRATFIHGVFDEAPIVFTELANAPDYLPITVYLNQERFSLDTGTVESFHRDCPITGSGWHSSFSIVVRCRKLISEASESEKHWAAYLLVLARKIWIFMSKAG